MTFTTRAGESFDIYSRVQNAIVCMMDRKRMPRRRSTRSLLGDLLALPWWVSVISAALVYFVVGLAIPFLFEGSSATREMGEAALDYGWMIALLFLVPAPFAVLRRYRRRMLLDAQTGLESICNLHWQDFEQLVAEAFSRIGYTVSAGAGSSSEGGLDLIATTGDETLLVQCKHWRAAMVGVSTIGDLAQSIAAENATGGAVVTSGTFSEDAVAFASGKSIQLIDGEQLEKLVLSVKDKSPRRFPGLKTQ